jgi:opacity protein-like surface antigen
MLTVRTISMLTATSMLALAATPALAGEPYVGVSVGATLQQKSNDRGTFTSTVPATAAFPAIASGTPLTLETRFKTGFNIAGQAGYRFDNGFRVEAEVGYSENDVKRHNNLTVGGTNIDAVDVAVLTRGVPAAANPTVGTVIGNGGKGRLRNFSVFGNAYYDFNREGSLQPYIGGGLGVQEAKVRYQPSDVPVANGKKAVFAYQLMAGVTYKISPSFEVFGQYNYRSSDRANIPLSIVPATFDVQNKASVLSLGMRIPLGAK